MGTEQPLVDATENQAGTVFHTSSGSSQSGPIMYVSQLQILPPKLVRNTVPYIITLCSQTRQIKSVSMVEPFVAPGPLSVYDSRRVFCRRVLVPIANHQERYVYAMLLFDIQWLKQPHLTHPWDPYSIPCNRTTGQLVFFGSPRSWLAHATTSLVRKVFSPHSLFIQLRPVLSPSTNG